LLARYLVNQSPDGVDQQQVAWQSAVQSMPIDLDEIVQRAESTAGQGIRIGLSLPAGAGAPFRFDSLVGDTRVRVLLDHHSGRILRVERTQGQSLAESVEQKFADLHYGRLPGTISRALWVILGVLPLVLFATATLMWWNRTGRRRPVSQRAALASPPRESRRTADRRIT
jgi:uncharacterized iron-regulated membrane protein